MVLLTKKTLDEIITYLEKSITPLAKEAFKNLVIEGEFQRIESFLENQFELRLENLFEAKKVFSTWNQEEKSNYSEKAKDF